MITTPLCDLLGVQRPILNASMAGTATGALAAAVSEAGGFGMIGGTNSDGAPWLREQVRIARTLTSRPFGVGFISAFPDTAELAAVALDEGVAAINHSFADPAPFVASTHAAGALLMVQVQSLRQAVRAADAGADVIIAQGGEAGGHAGATGTFALLPAIVDAVSPIPVIAAGGIADGRGLAAALLLGAQGVWMGTRFVASQEWGGPRWEQDAVVAATSDDTVQTRIYDVIGERPFPAENPDRMIRNAFIDRWAGREAEVPGQRDVLKREVAAGHERADLTVAGVSAGVSAGLVTSVRPAGQIVEEIVREAEDLLRQRLAMLVRDY
ncbi:MAG TPA: nitronate monooxygenase [Thermomicrobiales bacterium]|jgi:nitronate monooxygenase|nr:nitronate monooxygenase [Thermomicrobiales bacterium]